MEVFAEAKLISLDNLNITNTIQLIKTVFYDFTNLMKLYTASLCRGRVLLNQLTDF